MMMICSPVKTVLNTNKSKGRKTETKFPEQIFCNAQISVKGRQTHFDLIFHARCKFLICAMPFPTHGCAKINNGYAQEQSY